MRKRTSIIWTKFSDEEFVKNAHKSATMKDFLLLHGLSNKGNNYRTAKKRMVELGIPNDCFPPNYHRIVSLKKDNKKELSEIMVEHSDFSTTHLKKRLIKDGLLDTKCSICGITEWNGKPLSFILDHINGICDDHRSDNLRLVCPNCDSQLDTYCGKNVKKKHYYCSCGKEIDRRSKLCRLCLSISRRKVERPARLVLENDVKYLGYSATGRKYGVSDNTIRKWLKDSY